MATDTATRLAAYKATELKILKAQEIGGGDITHKMAELAEVRKAIDALESQLRRETATAAGNGGMRYSVANLNRGN